MYYCYSTGPLLRNTYFEQGLNKTLLPPRMQAQFLNSRFLFASQEYCTYFLFPPFLVSNAVISSSYGSHCFFLLYSVVVAILKTNFRCQYYRTCVTIARLCDTCSVVPGTVQ